MTTHAGRGAAGAVVTSVTAVCGAAMWVFGWWALLAPTSFADLVGFPPYNEHLLHDVGAFQIGIGTSLFAALIWPDAIGVALVGFLAADLIHTANHALDRHLGGHLGDIWFLGGLGAAALLALLLHLRRPPHPSQPKKDTQ